MPIIIDEIYTATRKVVCAGEQEVIGHPKIYLEIASDSDHIICPYCSKKFILK